MTLIPLEPREYLNDEDFQLNLVLDPDVTYEMAVVSMSCEGLSDGIGTIYSNVVNATQLNDKQILHRFSKYDTFNQPCYYIIDTFNLRSITLRIEGVSATSIALTIAIRNAQETTAH